MDMVNLIAVNCGNVAMGWVDSQALEVGAGGFYYCNYSSAWCLSEAQVSLPIPGELEEVSMSNPGCWGVSISRTQEQGRGLAELPVFPTWGRAPTKQTAVASIRQSSKGWIVLFFFLRDFRTRMRERGHSVKNLVYISDRDSNWSRPEPPHFSLPPGATEFLSCSWRPRPLFPQQRLWLNPFLAIRCMCHQASVCLQSRGQWGGVLDISKTQKELTPTPFHSSTWGFCSFLVDTWVPLVSPSPSCSCSLTGQTLKESSPPGLFVAHSSKHYLFSSVWPSTHLLISWYCIFLSYRIRALDLFLSIYIHFSIQKQYMTFVKIFLKICKYIEVILVTVWCIAFQTFKKRV